LEKGFLLTPAQSSKARKSKTKKKVLKKDGRGIPYKGTKIKNKSGTGDVTQVVEYLPSA
jgi:hypothetical protein